MPRDVDRALSLYRASCQTGAAIACTNAANVLRDRGEAQQALRLLEQACASEDPAACYQLGRLLRSGEAGERDPERALELASFACRSRILAACVDHADHLRRGDGTPIDLAAAYAILSDTCERNSVVACTQEGAMALDEGTPFFDRERGARLMLRACGSDVAEACWTLAQLLDDAPAADNTAEDAPVYAARACALGLDAACEAQLSD